MATNGVIKRMNPAGLPRPRHTSHVVEDTASGLIYVTGQVALDADSEIVGDDVPTQLREVFRHFDVILDHLGLDRTAFVKVLTMTTDVESFYQDGGFELYAEYFAGGHPAASLTGVPKLARDDFLIEIEAVLSRSQQVGS